MRRKFELVIKKFGEGYSPWERADREYMEAQIREVADHSEGFKNTVFEMGVHAMVKKIAKSAKASADTTDLPVMGKDVARLLKGMILCGIHPQYKDGKPNGNIYVFVTEDENPETRKFRSLCVYGNGEVEVSDLY